jgi:hypothetical protein
MKIQFLIWRSDWLEVPGNYFSSINSIMGQVKCIKSCFFFDSAWKKKCLKIGCLEYLGLSVELNGLGIFFWTESYENGPYLKHLCTWKLDWILLWPQNGQTPFRRKLRKNRGKSGKSFSQIEAYRIGSIPLLENILS